ncbi:DUF2235 domain-containing protein [Novosphingopyxis baekryungensis]|uniref:DUF2235 domain-containing protein n=1 Tax=Novosphingopyxis baekryungensis TaxID=279369 RepID=UPI0003FBAD4B|nr:DUF2235 domain-containing protein [Novosphingopyxis baekryungensis]
MAKNIMIFADGTGQIGGIKPDQRLSNVYKMFRAMRPGPASSIMCQDQVAYYDPGLGAGEIEGVTFSKIRNIFESAVGAGIEDNMIDCYERILSYYEAGDRIILIGFSRGAYTVRALANMMNLCGVPTQQQDGKPIPKSGKILREIATEAVKSVYGHGTGKPRGLKPYFQQREEKGRRFRENYGCEDTVEQGNKRGNVEPTFVGVFDTVAALQNSVLTWIIRGIFGAAFTAALCSFLLSWSIGWTIGLVIVCCLSIFGYMWTVSQQIRFYEPDPANPLSLMKPWHWPHILKNTHRAYWRKKNYDMWLSPQVCHARHALSIDEYRSNFPRVGWGLESTAETIKDRVPAWLKQVWFAGCHSDVGGSYPENESRLSDISLNWMVEELRDCVPMVKIQAHLLVTNPDSLGLQHDEIYMWNKWWLKIKWPRKARRLKRDIPLHPTVLERLAAKNAPHENVTKPYRPTELASHPQAKDFYK